MSTLTFLQRGCLRFRRSIRTWLFVEWRRCRLPLYLDGTLGADTVRIMEDAML